jgi:hypothetical protein
MKFELIRAGITGLVVAMLATILAQSALAARETTPDDVARFLAGMPPEKESPLAPLTARGAWKQHAKVFDGTWRELDKRQLSPIRAWGKTHLQKPADTLLYMFSGPDFLYADAFFPSASTYVLTALEPVGRLPAVDDRIAGALSTELGALRASLGSVLSYSFFITKKMKTQLRARRLSGTLPPLYVFLARSGKRIHKATLVDLDPQGRLVIADAKTARVGSPGVEIVFSGADGRQRKLYYFQADISNSGFQKTGLEKFAAGLGRADALIKSASYLLHSGGFTHIRKFLLQASDTVVQDDSGIPVVHFDAKAWQLRSYGRYLGPIAEFPGRYQKRLADIFRRNPQQRIDFGIGYRWRRNESNLLVARRIAPAPGRSASGD